jgi:putative acetyltransferase
MAHAPTRGCRRLAEAADLAAVHAIHNHPSVTPYLTYEPMDAATFAPLFDEMVASRNFWLWVVDGDVAGFYRTTRLPGRVSHVVMLGTLAVAPDRHGQGIGRAMLNDAINHCRAAGVRRLELYAESDNAAALAFYQRMGFVIEGTLRGYYRRADDAEDIDEHVLGLLIGPD